MCCGTTTKEQFISFVIEFHQKTNHPILSTLSKTKMVKLLNRLSQPSIIIIEIGKLS